MKRKLQGGIHDFFNEGGLREEWVLTTIALFVAIGRIEPELRICWIKPKIHSKTNLKLQGKINPLVALSWLKPS